MHKKVGIQFQYLRLTVHSHLRFFVCENSFYKIVEKINMCAKEIVQLEGEIVELLPSTMFKVKLENDHEILAHISGKMRIHFIKLMPGDTVEVEMSPYDLTKGRITRRL
jgi:translation initiation factor IF-1